MLTGAMKMKLEEIVGFPTNGHITPLGVVDLNSVSIIDDVERRWGVGKFQLLQGSMYFTREIYG